VRIIGGSRRGRKLVEWEATGIRPMRDFVRSALFNIVRDFVRDSDFLDLYCGTGSVGLEALSRGAASCLFVDRSSEACGIVRRNLEALDLLSEGRVLEENVLIAIDELTRLGRRFDMVFVGPPYFHELVPATLERLSNAPVLAEDFVVVAEIHHTESAAMAYGSLVQVDARRYGDNRLLFYRRENPRVADPYQEA
jgi:16S rRNA (guanine966-N2)-methyltransferase